MARLVARVAAPLVALGTVPLLTVGAAVPATADGPCAPLVNKVACENTLEGVPESQWRVTAPDESIVGFTTDISVNVGGRVDFKIRTDATSYRVDIYRLGWYGGDGARLVDSVLPAVPLPQHQPPCLTNESTALVDCGNWAVSASWQVPATAVSGLYYAVPHRSNGGENEIFFVVRDDASHADLYFQTSDTTWQAYNTYGGNSLYTGTGPGPDGSAWMVSYNRPLSGAGEENMPFNAEYPMIRFLERNGYDVSYASGVDSDRLGDLIRQHRVFLSVGHDEYWSGGQRAKVEQARAAGVHLAFFSGNEVFWKTRWLPSADPSATPHRTLVCYKETKHAASIDPSDEWTGTWRDPRLSTDSEPENALIGQQFLVNGRRDDALSVSAAYGKLRLWRDTDLASLPVGATFTFAAGTLGYEWDSYVDNGAQPPGVARFSSTTVTIPEGAFILRNFGDDYGPGTATHNLTLYRDQTGGGLVFGAGTVQWAWGLDDSHSFRTEVPTADLRIQQATVNLFADMHVSPATLRPELHAATASTDTTPPAVTVGTPSPASPKVAAAVTFGGTVTDAAGHVAGVEVSVDGVTWHPATWNVGSPTWSYVHTPGVAGPLTVRVRAVDDSANLSAPASRTVTIGPRECPCGIFTDATVPGSPALPDIMDVELGVKWRATVDGWVTGVRFYKGTGNTGTHTGSLWAVDGTRLATGTFTGETATGWQTVTFGRAVPVRAGTTYVASYHVPVGHYAADVGFFTDRGVSNEPLVALQGGVDGPNGVFRTGPSGFPDNTFNNTNYYADVVFVTEEPPDTQPPAIASTTPPSGGGGARLEAPVTVAFDEPVAPDTLQFALNGESGAVGGLLTLDATHTVATFAPSAHLAGGTRYTASVRASDAAGNPMPAPFTWQFTTGVPRPATCPCTIWDDFTLPATPETDDPNAIELGTRVRFDTKGFVMGVRFYKGARNTGTHLGSLWTGSGTRLATGTFSGETATGWQTLTFAEPVRVQANTDYVVSYHTDTGFYSSTRGYFGAQEASFRSLHAPRDGADGSNGLFRYGASGFPTSSFASTNYWVDVLFTNSLSGDQTPPEVTAFTPADGASGVTGRPTLTATFDEALDPELLTFTLRDAGGARVTGAVSYDPALRRASLLPDARLSAGATYTASVRAADVDSNLMDEPVTWSFTVTAVQVCPCTLFSPATVPTIASSPDTTPLTLGVRLRADADGQVTGIRFYKGAANTGTHTGTLWTATGTPLASGTFGPETATGWQTLTFAAPVPVEAGQVYVASYTAPNGGYAVDNHYFTARDAVSIPLVAPLSAVGAPNAVYQVGDGFPDNTFQGSNYWVDVVFETLASPPAPSGEAGSGVDPGGQDGSGAPGTPGQFRRMDDPRPSGTVPQQPQVSRMSFPVRRRGDRW